MKKIILLLSSCVLILDTSFAQEIEWQNTIGGSNWEVLRSIQQTSDGGYILGGYSDSNISGDKTENSNGSYDYWIVKTDALGNIQWQNTIGGSDVDYLYCIQQTADGGYILGGWSNSDSSGDKTENNWDQICSPSCTYDYWIVKTDVSGNIQWENTIGGTDDDFLNSIQQTADGGYILGGNSGSNISGDKTENNFGIDHDYWIVKTDASGNIQWENTIGGFDSDGLQSIQQTADGGYILGGQSYSNISFDKTENCIGVVDYWIVKTDSAGNIQWQNTIGGSYYDRLNSIQQTADGGYILGGYSGSDISGDKTENCIGPWDYWIVKTDSLGYIQWQNTIGGSYSDEPYSLQQTTDGGYILGGFSNSNISGDKTENSWDTTSFNHDFWVVKTDASGNIQWQNTIGGIGDDNLYSIQQTSNGGYILGGYSDSNISGDKTENNSGGTDYWIVKLSGNYNLITGKLFIDANSNAVQDASEPAVLNKQVAEINTGRFGFSQNAGVYYVSLLDSGNFSVYTSAQINYYAAVPATYGVYFAGLQQTDSLNDFAFQPTGVFNDLCVTITPLSPFRTGFNASYMINYENVGTTTLSPTVIFFPDSDITFVSSNVTPTSVTTDSIAWNFGPLAPYQSGSILVTVNVNVVPNGTIINSGVRIEPVAGDANTACNYSYWEVLSTGAVDPNEILVDEDTLYSSQLTNPPYLEYIIYFQNTGNDTAFTVKVLNPVDTFKLQPNTLELVASSHPMNITYKPWERNFEFTFNNILLPDSNVNEPGSHGFVRYRIKPKTTLVAGDSIRNTAYIYFDFNAPVRTNTAVTEIVLPTGEEEFKVQSSKFKVFPNPVKDELTVSSKQFGESGVIRIFDLYGREVLKMEAGGQKSEVRIDVSLFSQGVYFVQVQSGEQVLRGKFLKE